MGSEERYSRQKDLVPGDALAKVRATVVGVGAIGRQVALQLAAMGVPWLQLIDFDIVEESNLASQGYLENDLGVGKAVATADLCVKVSAGVEVRVRSNRFTRSLKVGTVVFCCVDSIETRKFIWEAVKGHVDFFVDGRMSAEVIRVLLAGSPDSREHYPTTLFTAAEAHTGSCTAKTTIYCANVAAGLMVAQFAKHLRHMPIDADVCLNLLSGEWSAQET